MAGGLREALARLRERVAVLTSSEGSETLPADLLAVVQLLDREPRLRNAMSDPSLEASRREGLARTVLAGKVGRAALEVVEEAARQRWARARNLVDALEVTAARAAFASAEGRGAIDRVEEDVFRFGRLVRGDDRLRSVLTAQSTPAAARRALVGDLLEGRADATSVMLLQHVVAVPRGRTPEEAVDELSALAAERREQLLAQVTVATELTAEQEQRLTAALTRLYGREVKLHVDVDPQVVGGVRVVVGDEVVDGTTAHKLEQARRRLVG